MNMKIVKVTIIPSYSIETNNCSIDHFFKRKGWVCLDIWFWQGCRNVLGIGGGGGGGGAKYFLGITLKFQKDTILNMCISVIANINLPMSLLLALLLYIDLYVVIFKLFNFVGWRNIGNAPPPCPLFQRPCLVCFKTGRVVVYSKHLLGCFLINGNMINSVSSFFLSF